MQTVVIVLAVVTLCIALLYLLYINAFLVIRAMSALVFLSTTRWWSTRPSAKVRSCTGYARKVLKFKESRTYQFSFTSKLSKGSVTAEIQGRNQETLLLLDSEHANGALDVKAGERYYLVVRFKGATGRFELSWS